MKRETCTHWRITLKVRIQREHELVELKHHQTGIPGTRAQAVRHLKRVCLTLWPTGKSTLERAIPDRQAEKREQLRSVPQVIVSAR